ncbi:VOC family protein [Jiangella muralis]|uniref:VOC family protein n=1 Tax=Jiangella muralis TaxID=702383 RepID=UPI00069E7622|nr:VOC family protein [Jiangella muralis]
MSTLLNPYIGFRDNARQAMEFYQSVFGGELRLSTFADLGAGDDPAEAGKIMHGQLESENGLVLMAADTPNSMEHSPGGNVSISLSGDDEPTLRDYWEKLSGDGAVTVPLETAPWGDAFGMCTDRFGVAWLVNITAVPPA